MSTLVRNSLATAIFVVGLTLLHACRSEQPRPIRRSDIPHAALQSADVAFRLGRSIESDVIAACDGKKGYSHVGVIIRSDTATLVVHVEPSRSTDERVRCERADDFFRSDRASAGAVMRIDGITDRQRSVITAYVLSLVEAGIGFDHDYSMTDSTRMYCTELVERAFASAGISLSQGRRHKLPLAKEEVIMPSDIEHNNLLSIIWSFTSPESPTP